MIYQTPVRSNELYHHGILGMRWGVRRYQNKDGSLTPAGRRRLAKITTHAHQYSDEKRQMVSKAMTSEQRERVKAASDKLKKATIESEKADKRLDDEVDRRLRKKYGDDYHRIFEDQASGLSIWDSEYKKVRKDNPKDVQKIKDDIDAYHAYKKVGQQVAKELLGKYANRPVRGVYNNKMQERAYEELSLYVLEAVENVHLK